MDYTGGSDPIRGITIENIEFNIPVGYEKNNTKTIINQTINNENGGYILNQQTYENSEGREISISIIDYNEIDINPQNLHVLCKSCDKKNIKGYPGYIRRSNNKTQFTYAFNNKKVQITATNEDLINQILIVEDA